MNRPEYFQRYHYIRNRKLKEEAFEAYGGAICCCCGITEWNFLSLDHMNGRTEKDNKNGVELYSQLKLSDWPPGYQVLCHNCNMGRYLNGGTCPHNENGGPETHFDDCFGKGPLPWMLTQR